MAAITLTQEVEDKAEDKVPEDEMKNKDEAKRVEEKSNISKQSQDEDEHSDEDSVIPKLRYKRDCTRRKLKETKRRKTTEAKCEGKTLQNIPIDGGSKWCHGKSAEDVNQERKQQKQQRKRSDEDTEREVQCRKKQPDANH